MKRKRFAEDGHPGYHALPAPDDAHVVEAAGRIAERVRGLLERRGLGPEADPDEADSLAARSASVAGRIATGPHAGQRVPTAGNLIEHRYSEALTGPRSRSGFRQDRSRPWTPRSIGPRAHGAALASKPGPRWSPVQRPCVTPGFHTQGREFRMDGLPCRRHGSDRGPPHSLARLSSSLSLTSNNEPSPVPRGARSSRQ